jgi:hypothetical protein
MPIRQVRRVAGVVFLLALAAAPGRAANHSDAPLSKQDPQTNLTDVFAFVSNRTDTDTTKVLNVIVQVRPFCEPGDGAIYDRYADDALYSIIIADPASGAAQIQYDFQFSPVSVNGNYKNLGTALSYGRGADKRGAPDVGSIQTVGDAHHNFVQTYTVTKTTFGKGGKSAVITGTPPPLTPPPNVGMNTTPLYNDANGVAVSGAMTVAALDAYTKQTVYLQTTGETTFAGSRDDGFFADIPGIFDLLEARLLDPNGTKNGQGGTGDDGFKGFNVLVYALQIPLSQLPSLPYSLPAVIGGNQTGVGVYAAVSRPRITLRSTTGPNQNTGPFIQVNRMGNPLFNEDLVALADKDNFNRDVPTSDKAKYQKYANAPEVAVLMNATFGTNFTTSPRPDLVAIFIPEVLRVNTGTGPVRLAGQAGFSRLTVFGGDTTTDTFKNTVPSGWPNGRRFGDDVVDIAFSTVASGPTFTSITILGDNVNANDEPFNGVFPFAATPHAGPRNSKDSGPNLP